MTIKNCPHCGGDHFGSYTCPFISIERGAEWLKKEPAACLYECSRCGHEEVWPWADHYCSECNARGNPPSLMVFRRYATENDCVTD